MKRKPKFVTRKRADRMHEAEEARRRYAGRYAEFISNLPLFRRGTYRPKQTLGMKRWWIVQPNVSLGLPGVRSRYAVKENARRRRRNKIARASRRVNRTGGKA